VLAKDRIAGPYVTLLIAIVLMVDAQRLPVWVTFVILGALWAGFEAWSKR
jgi:hypothetical protein